MSESKGSIHPDDRVWYDQFTSTDWVHDTIADSHRVKALRSRKDFVGRLRVLLDGVQGWILSALSGFIIALVAYTVNVAEATVFDFKDGYCSSHWYHSEKASRIRLLFLMMQRELMRSVFNRNAAQRELATRGGAGLM